MHLLVVEKHQVSLLCNFVLPNFKSSFFIVSLSPPISLSPSFAITLLHDGNYINMLVSLEACYLIFIITFIIRLKRHFLYRL